MTWDVPTAEDCPKCGQTMFKKSGRGRMKPFCVNESCENFLPEDKRGYYKKKTEGEATSTEEKPAKKTARKKTAKAKEETVETPEESDESVEEVNDEETSENVEQTLDDYVYDDVQVFGEEETVSEETPSVEENNETNE